MLAIKISLALLASGAFAARPFLNEPDTGIELAIPDIQPRQLPELDRMVGLPDFEWAARNYLPVENYTYYRNGAAGEWSYRNNLEIFQKFHLRPRAMVDITNIEGTVNTTILGYDFSAPFFISPCARASIGHPDAELNLVKAAGAQNLLYIPSQAADMTIEEIADARQEKQVIFQQMYLNDNNTRTQVEFDRAKAAGVKAIVLTVDSAADGNRHRAARFGVGFAGSTYTYLTMSSHLGSEGGYDSRRAARLTGGISTVDDAKLAAENGVPGIILSNHGGRQLDTTQSSLETALEIHREDAEIFQKIEVLADGGVRYGADALKLLALGVKAVGIGRPFMYANIFGEEGVEKAIKLMKHEVAIDAANLGVSDLKKINYHYVNWNSPGYYSG
ncbi:FMN-dependent dehydrogenase [Fusarium albosuccineum]|uniref:FMN-dependent dehydrogenase n=1 Tax=Fusarium albosuccineum TaxID=1237068 RepID=A0A8H4L9G5_9HYPO|nr:FMN-dependent dehydrogenase [Fusarium albosuccineum]